MGMRLRAMATSMKDLVGDPLDEFAAKFTAEFVRLGICSTMYVHTEVQGDCCLSRLVRLAPGETPPKWDGEDPREGIFGGNWKLQIGGVTFLGEQPQGSNPSQCHPHLGSQQGGHEQTQISYTEVGNPYAKQGYSQPDNQYAKPAVAAAN